MTLDYNCSTGYTKKVGRLGGGDGGIGKELSGVSPMTCKHECDLDTECKSYVYSEKHLRCKLQNEPLPLSNLTYLDYVWCSKSKCINIKYF